MKIPRRRLPHLYLEGSVYFVTFRLKRGELTPDERSLVLDHLKSGDRVHYSLVAAVVMPDHVHIVLAPFAGIGLRRVLTGIKGVSARRLNRLRRTTGALWLDESFDRVLRDQKELEEKLTYMLNNPAKNGLVQEGAEYPWWYFNEKSLGGDAMNGPEGSGHEK